MSKTGDITNGFINLAKDKLDMLTEENKERNKSRMSICMDCEHRTDRGRGGKCGCVLAAKTKCDTCTCPIAKW